MRTICSSFLIAAAFLLILTPAASAAPTDNESCFECHDDEEVSADTARGEFLELNIVPDVFGDSIHGDLQCVNCHRKADTWEDSPHNDGEPVALGCSGSDCHDDATDEFGASAHGQALAEGAKGAPTCRSCHRIHYLEEPAEEVLIDNKIVQEKLCLSCHVDNPDVRAQVSPKAGFIAAYEQSVHGAAVLDGDEDAANCVDCHGSHQMLKGFDPDAKTNKRHVVETCSKCHDEIGEEFSESSHGVALAKGNTDSPTCTNCHGEHMIYKHDDPRSPVADKNLSQQVCSPCHSSLALTQKYGLQSNRFATFADSYHGLAIQGGEIGVANCASCHSSHNIKPSSDPTSTISKENIATTCGECHPKANERFAIGSVHIDPDPEGNEAVLYWIGLVYSFLIVGIIGGMTFHNAIDFRTRARRKLAIRHGELEAEHGHAHAGAKPKLYLRMSVNERIQHGALVISFITLVITGFMLRYPTAGWVQGIASLSSSVFEWRSLIHRIAGVVMVAASVYHIYYIAATQRGRQLVRDLFPRWQDAKDAVALVKFNLGFAKERPKFDRFGYAEKAEYWALVWGNIVMAATGVIMWFDNYFMGLFTKFGYDISRAIHFYEAWLAALAILVWHIYFVIFNPDVYPINLAFLKGTVTEEEMRDEHPLELERLESEKKD